MTVYLDIVFIENIIIDYIIILAIVVIKKEKPKFLKGLFASIIGAIYAVFSYIFNFKVIISFILKIVLSVIMMQVTFMPKKIEQLVKDTILFYFTSFVFGGSAIAIIYMLDAKNINIQNGVLVGNYTIKTMILGTIVAFVIIYCTTKFIKNKITKEDIYCKIKFKLNGKQVQTKAMLDTGNLLREPITNIPVIVVEQKILLEVLPKEILENTENILAGKIEMIPRNVMNKYMNRLKVIPYRSLGKQNGMLLGIIIQEIEVEMVEKTKVIEKAIIGIYNKNLSKTGEYKALVGLELI